MRNRRITSIIFVIVGFMFSGVALFANSLGLDDHSGWGRLRIMVFVANILLALFAVLYLLFQTRADSIATDVWFRMGHNPFLSRLLNNRSVARLSSILQEYWFTLPVIACVTIIYIWLISSGTWTTWVSPTRHYATLAKGFEQGKLFMTTRPDPRLAELPDPYDPFARQNIQTPVDVTYYKGRYYLYWGPVPALMLVPVQAILTTRVGDLQLVFFFTCGTFLLLCILVILLWDQYFHDLPRWMLGMSILLIGTANPTLFMLNNFKGARIYEAAITGGQFFLVGGLLVAVIALRKSSLYWMLAFAGSLWALSIGTRLFLVLPICAMVLILALSWLGTKQRLIEKAANLLAVGFPLLLGFLALGWYNWERFGSVTESGLYYQLAGINLQKNYDILLDRSYFFQNLYNYLIHPFEIDTQFPFVRVEEGSITSILPSYLLPPLYNSQQMTGVLPGMPFAIFAGISFTTIKPAGRGGHGGTTLPWIVWLLSGSFAAAFVFLMFFFWSAMRYIQDFMPSLLVLSIIGFWQGYRLLSDSPAHKVYIFFGSSLAGASILISILLAISINDARFQIIQFLELL